MPEFYLGLPRVSGEPGNRTLELWSADRHRPPYSTSEDSWRYWTAGFSQFCCGKTCWQWFLEMLIFERVVCPTNVSLIPYKSDLDTQCYIHICTSLEHLV